MKCPTPLFDEPSFEYVIVVSDLGLTIFVTIPAKIMVSKYGSVLYLLAQVVCYNLLPFLSYIFSILQILACQKDVCHRYYCTLSLCF